MMVPVIILIVVDSFLDMMIYFDMHVILQEVILQ